MENVQYIWFVKKYELDVYFLLLHVVMYCWSFRSFCIW